MSLDERGYLHNITKERIKLHDATIKPVEVTPKPQGNRLCNNCHQSLAEPYLQPPSRFIDENGIDNAGFKPNHWYWKCSNIVCNYKEEMITQQESNKKGYKTKTSVISKLPMHLGTYNVHKQSWDGRNRKRRYDTIEEEDLRDLAALTGGYQPSAVELRDSRDISQY